MELQLRVPASTANLGPGFDALGLALTFYNRVNVKTREEEGVSIAVEGEGKGILSTSETNMFYRSAVFTAERVGKALPGLDVHMQNDVPLARGLGSSSTAIVSGVLIANRLFDHPFSKERCLDIATEIEGHPDNVAPCLLGGLTMAACTPDRVACMRAVPPEGLRVVVVIPQFELKTRTARCALPKRVPIKDAVFNISRACMLTTALITGDWPRLKTGMEDRVHQPYRAKLIPAFENLLTAAYETGALGAALSGAGPTVMAFVQNRGEAVGRAMVETWERANISSQYHLLDIDSTGAVFE